jgi:hypothetical protein
MFYDSVFSIFPVHLGAYSLVEYKQAGAIKTAFETDACTVSMDRRGFIQKAATLAAGSALGSPLLSCGGSPAAPPRATGGTLVRASEIGCALDCDLTTGLNRYTGGKATDDGPRINAALAGASATHPITLIIDGGALISGLFLPAAGHWSIVGLGSGTGFFVMTGTNNDGIHNGSATVVSNDPGPPAPATRGGNVTLSNFTLNGNRGNGLDGDSTSGMFQGNNLAFFFGINLINLNNITIENLVVVNTPSYHIRFCNVGNVTVSGCIIQGEGVNSDGLHFDGPANDITISNCSFNTGDDAIALNAPEGYGGNISRVTVANCTFNSWSLMRLYTVYGKTQYLIDTVSVSGCTGVFSTAAFKIGLADASLPNAVTGLTISNCNLTAAVVLGITENFGSIVLSNVTWVPAISDAWIALEPNHVPAFVRRPPDWDPKTYTGSSLTFRNCIIQRKSDMAVACLVLESGVLPYDTSIGYVEFDGFAMQDVGSFTPAKCLIEIDQGSVGQLVINSVQSENITAAVSAGGFSSVGSVSGAGLLASGWPIPDAVMANGVPYISATTGLPSIKVNGVVQPYP